MPRAVRTLIVAALAFAALAAPASAGIWTEIPSNTTEEITAIEYRGGQFWYATGSGKIYRRVGGAFQQEYASATGVVFRDIEFNAAGTIGLAVGTNAGLLRSTNGGDTWSPVALPNSGHVSSETNCSAAQAPGDLDSVKIDGLGRAWIAGGGSQLWKSTGTGASLGTGWQDANNGPGTDCFLPRDIDDMVFIPGGPAGYFVAKSFGQVYFTSNSLTTTASQKIGDAGNGFTTVRRMAGDPSNTNRMWAVTPGGDGTSYIARTIDGWNGALDWTIANAARRNFSRAFDIDYAGGTVLAAGSAGMVLHSIEGESFYYDDADGALATQDWRAVSLADGANGAIGGTNGKLAVTSQANVVPDIVKPTGTISGPSTAVAGQAVAFTLNAADTGGSGLNPASYSWTVAGLPGQSGNPASFTFPGPGFYTVRVGFADNAGNTETATKSISVSQGSSSGGGAAPTFSLSGPGNSATARIVGNRVRVRMRGTIRPPAGVSTTSACNGKVRLTVKKKRKTLHKSRARLKLKNGRCRFGKTVFIKRSKLGKATRLRLKVRFAGNSVLSAGQTTKTLVVKK